MSKKSSIIIHLSTYVILIGLLLVATFFDQKISEFAYIGGGISVVGAVLGKLPAWFMACMASGILFKGALHKEKRYKVRVPLLIVYGVLAYACGFMMGLSVVDDVIDGMVKYIVTGVVGLSVGTCTLIFANMVSLDYINKLKKWSMLALVSVGIIAVLTLLVKIGWGRDRYVDIVNGDKIFTAWYLPQGMDSAGTSMPSGHTAFAACIFLLPLFYHSLPDMKKYTLSTYLLAWIITILVAVTRLLGGYHFMSDVVVSTIIAYTTILCVYYIGFGKDLNNSMLKENGFMNKF